MNTILRLSAVKDCTGLSRSSIYVRMGRGEFPRSISLGGPRCVGWLAEEVSAWIAERVELSRPTKNIETTSGAVSGNPDMPPVKAAEPSGTARFGKPALPRPGLALGRSPSP
jgi:prophage regulatory protein